MEAQQPARIALVGAHGFGLVHRRNLARLAELGRARLVAVADPVQPAPGELDPTVRVHADLASLLAAESGLDAVIVSTPLHTHLPLAVRALESGADLYLEKPPVTSLAQFETLRTVAAATGRLVQVGFQSLGSHAIGWLRDEIEHGGLGAIRSVTATGSWTRDRAYFTRSSWAGRRALDGVDVVDGVATNALSHAVITAMTVAGVRGGDDVVDIVVDPYRANAIEADDTTVVRVRTAGGLADITCALTLCGPEEAEPVIAVNGTAGRASLRYVIDEVELAGADGVTTGANRFGRTDLLENLIDVRLRGGRLLGGLDRVEAYMHVLDAVRTGPAPRAIPSEHVDIVGSGDRERLIVRDIETIVRRAGAAEATFDELGLPWAPLRGGRAVTIADAAVVERRDGQGLAASLSPRPYLHPVRTRAGVTLTDHLPLDHPWHLGVGVAVPDAGGTNLWGGPDYRHEEHGYRWTGSNGRMRVLSSVHSDDGFVDELAWCDRRSGEIVRERRMTRVRPVDERTWRLDLSFALTAVAAGVVLAGPGARGRDGAGYGGFFWRFAPCRAIDVVSPVGRGEAELNGARSPWLLWRAAFASGPASVLFVAPPESDDAWFVRTSDYPGVGSALVGERELPLRPDATVQRSLTAFVVDGLLDVQGAAAIAAAP